jgi:hypothetical protein
VDKFAGFIDQRLRPPGGFKDPFAEMGACVLDRGQGNGSLTALSQQQRACSTAAKVLAIGSGSSKW